MSQLELIGATVFRHNPWESDCEALVLAAAKGYLDIVELLLDAGVNKDSQDFDGNTAAHLAAANGHDEVLLSLRDHGAWPQQRNVDGLNALQLAAGNCDPETVSALTPRRYPGWGEYRGYQEDERDLAGLFDEKGKANVARFIPRWHQHCHGSIANLSHAGLEFYTICMILKPTRQVRAHQGREYDRTEVVFLVHGL